MKKLILVAVLAAVGLAACFGLLGEVKKLTASDGEAGDFFGIGVAVSGDIAVVGANGEDTGGTEAGAAYVFQMDAGGTGKWGQVKKLLASDREAGDAFGYSVAVSYDIAVVGAYGEGSAGSSSGAAYVFWRDKDGTDNWGQVKKLVASDAEMGDYFGYSVAIDGSIIIVGAYGEDAGGADAGAAYVFQRDVGGTNNWGQVKKLVASDAQAGDIFGTGVAVDEDIAIVGAQGEDTGGADAGAAYVFRKDMGGTDNWGEVKQLLASDREAGDYFGYSVAVGGGFAVVGAPIEDAGSADAGAAYVFQRDLGGTDNWGELKKLASSDLGAGDMFGFGVAVGAAIVVGAPWEDAKGDNAGAAYIFQRDFGGPDYWGETQKITASDAEAFDNFGHSVADGGGGFVVVGAYLENTKGSYAGAAYVFGPILPVGGIQRLPDAADSTAVKTSESSESGWSGRGYVALIAGVAGATLIVGAGAWNLQRRRSRQE